MFDLQSLQNRRPFWYCLTFNFDDAADVGTRLTQSVRVADYPFVCTSIIVVTRQDDAGIEATSTDADISGGDVASHPDPRVLLEFSETGTDRVFQNGGQLIDGAAFSRIRNRPLPAPILIRPGATFTIIATIQAETAATTGADVRVMLEGFIDYSLK